MDQDIHFQHMTAFATGAVTTFFRVPYRCTLRNVSALVQADPGDAETITVTTGATVAAATAAGVLTFGTDIAAGAIAEWAPHADAAVLEEGSFIKMVTSAAAAANVDIDIELDPYAR